MTVFLREFRLNSFFATHDGSSRGNLALHDIISALKWIQQNVEQFGGDPSNVTVCGHGTGAILTNLLMVSPMAKGLFSRVILMSGSALSPSALNYQPLDLSMKLAETVGCRSTSPSYMMQCMRQKSVFELLSKDHSSYQTETLGFGPVLRCLDKWVSPQLEKSVHWFAVRLDWGSSLSKLVEDYPDVLMTSTYMQHYQSYDLMFSVAKVETYFDFSSQEVRFGLEEDRRNQLIQNYMNKTLPYHKEELSAISINEYTDWTKTIQHPINMLDATSEIIGDADIVAPMVLAANYHYDRHRKSSYFSVFSYQTTDGDYSDRMGCIHGEELPYLFGAPLAGSKLGYFQDKYSQGEKQLSDAIIAFWVNFARTGNPNLHSVQTHEDNRYKKIIWQPYDVMDKKYLSFVLEIFQWENPFATTRPYFRIYLNYVYYDHLAPSGLCRSTHHHDDMKLIYIRTGNVSLHQENELRNDAYEFDHYILMSVNT
ncbi:Neuroligin-3 [Nymphon striatum]|nr:Neuroligin-3 [Nymphon striatum]